MPVLCLLALLCAFSALPAAAAPSDVVYRVRLLQKHQPEPSPWSVIDWTDATEEGDSLARLEEHLATDALGSAFVSAGYEVADGRLVADLHTAFLVDAQRGMWKSLTNTLTVDVYVRGASGTPYRVLMAATGEVHASRYGGADGSLQTVNGEIRTSFEETEIFTNQPVLQTEIHDRSELFGGNTGVEIAYEGDTFSHAGTYTLTAPSRVTQTFCVLGCLTAPVHFDTRATGHVEMSAYPCTTTDAPGKTLACDAIATGVPNAATENRVQIAASPNPFNPTTVVSFDAAEDLEAVVEVFDLRGQRVDELYRGRPTGSRHEVRWDARGVASGVYVLRLSQGDKRAVAKVTVLK